MAPNAFYRRRHRSRRDRTSQIGETLEQRALLSCTAITVSGSGTAQVTGTSSDDTLNVSVSEFDADGLTGATDFVHIEINGCLEVFPDTDVLSVEFDADSGDDYFENDTDLPARATGGSGDDTLLGGGGSDTLTGGGDSDSLEGAAGADELSGGSGGDTLKGGGDDDTLRGGNGADSLNGNSGEDGLEGEGGDDTLFGSSQDDAIEGGDGDDLIDAGSGWDYASGGGDSDTIFGGGGSDTLDGGDHADEIHGGAGDDEIAGGRDADLIHGNAGRDFLMDHHGANTLMGGAGADEILGGAGADTIIAGDGNDLVLDHQGDNYIEGGDGRDSLEGGEGSDTILGGPQSDWIDGEGGNDSILGEAGADLIDGDEGADTIYGGPGADDLFGGEGADIIFGGAGDDGLVGAEGIDTLSGGSHDDRFIHQGEDSILGKTLRDVEVLFVNDDAESTTYDFDGDGTDDDIEWSAGAWDYEEIAEIDLYALRPMHREVGNTNLLQGPDGTLTFYRVSTATDADETPIAGTDLPLTWNDGSGGVWLQDEAFTEDWYPQLTLHEVAHVWQDSTGDFEDFMALSDWDEGALLSGSKVLSGDGKWNYDPTLATALFVRDQGMYNPSDDFATVFAAYFIAREDQTYAGDGATGIDTVDVDGVDDKLDYLEDFLSTL